MKNRNAYSFSKLSVVFVLIIISCMVTVNGATKDEINQPAMFQKQAVGSKTCTLVSAAMLVRRAAMASGNSNWASINENSMRSTAWVEGVGLRFNFTYAGISVSHAYFNSDVSSKLISLLNEHPEGIVIYNNKHAIIITDYTDGSFYCADPDPYRASGRIPISSASISVSSAVAYWYVSSPKINLSETNPPVQGFTMSQGYGKTIADGNYIIVPAKYKTSSRFYYLDVDGTDNPAKNHTNVSIWEAGSIENVNPVDMWTIKYEGNGFYSIKQFGCNVSLDVYGASKISGSNVVVYENNNSDAQRWSISPNGNGYRIQAKCSGFSLDVDGGIFNSGTNVMQYTNHDGDNQCWAFISVDVPISFDLDGGMINNSSLISPVIGTFGTANYNDLSFMIPTRTCYSFAGWYSDEGVLVYKSDGWCVNDGKYFMSFALHYLKPFTVHARWNGPNHDWNNYYTVDKAATSVSEGQKSIHCSRCNIIKTGSAVVIPMTSKNTYVTAISLSADPSTTIYAGKKTTIKATVSPSTVTNKKLSWKSSNKNYATVNSNGVVTTKKAGAGKTVTITVSAKDGSKTKASIKIKIVKDGVTKISLQGENLKVGSPLSLKAKVKGGKTANKKLTWKSSNTKYASVNSEGVVTAKSQGIGKSVTITAYATDGTGKKAKIKLKIQ